MILYVIVMELDGHCGLPKGHIEKGETEKETALREIKEETGISAVILDGFTMQIAYEMGNGNMKQTTYYCATYDRQEIILNDSELLDVKLLPFEEALSALTNQKQKDVLIQSNAFIMRTR